MNNQKTVSLITYSKFTDVFSFGIFSDENRTSGCDKAVEFHRMSSLALLFLCRDLS